MPCLRTLGEAQANDDKRRQYLHQPGCLDLLSCCDHLEGFSAFSPNDINCTCFLNAFGNSADQGMLGEACLLGETESRNSKPP